MMEPNNVLCCSSGWRRDGGKRDVKNVVKECMLVQALKLTLGSLNIYPATMAEYHRDAILNPLYAIEPTVMRLAADTLASPE